LHKLSSSLNTSLSHRTYRLGAPPDPGIGDAGEGVNRDGQLSSCCILLAPSIWDAGRGRSEVLGVAFSLVLPDLGINAPGGRKKDTLRLGGAQLDSS